MSSTATTPLMLPGMASTVDAPSVVLSCGMGLDSTCLLLRWLESVYAAQLVAGSGARPVGYGPPREGQRVAGIDEDKVLAIVGAHILQRRTELGFSQRDLAVLAAVDRAFLARVEQGLRNPSVVSLAKVAQAMDTTVSWLTRDI